MIRSPGQPDPSCAICGGSGVARVCGPAVTREGRGLVLAVRRGPTWVAVFLEEPAGLATTEIPCPSCIETREEVVCALERRVLVVGARGGGSC